MKKLFTLFLALGFLSSAFAQDRHLDAKDKNRDYTYNSGKPRGRGYDDRGVYNNQGDGSFSYMLRERDKAIRRINFDFDRRIDAVSRDRFLRSSQKERQINKLEKERRKELEQVYKRYDSKNKYNNKYYDKNFNRKQ